MKKAIHPDYMECSVRCSCGNTFITHSTKPSLHVELCNECHPFYTGQQKFVDTGGRVQRFSDKFGSAAASVAEREATRKAAKLAAAEAAEAAAKAAREQRAAKKAEKAAKYAEKAPKATAEAAEPVSEAPVDAEAAVETLADEVVE